MGDWMRAGAVAELADALLKTQRVSTQEHPPPETKLPPDPTLRDLAALGTVQEKAVFLEDAFSKLQEELRSKDAESARAISDMKAESEHGERLLGELQGRLLDVEARLIAMSEMKQGLEQARERAAVQEQQLADLHSRLAQLDEQRRQEQLGRAAGGEDPARAKLAKQEQELQTLRSELSKAVEETRSVSAKLSGRDQAVEDLRSQIQELSQLRGPGMQPVDTLTELGAGQGAAGPAASVESGGKWPAGIVDTPASESRGKAARFRPAVAIALLLAAAGVAGFYIMDGKRGGPARATPRPAADQDSGGPVPVAPVAPLDAQATGANASESDPSLAAEELVKNHSLQGVGEILGSRLEAAYPTQGQLPPWMVEKLDEDKYQVNFYVRDTPLVFQFEARPKLRMLRGLNPAAVAVLNGETPPSPVPPVRKGKKWKRREDVFATRGQEEAEPPAPRAGRKRRGTAAVKPAPASPADGTAEESRDSSSEDEKSIDELLLPGLEKPAKNTSGED